MALKSDKGSTRTIIFFVIAVPIIAGFLWYAHVRKQESGPRAQACADHCTAQGAMGHEFKWEAFSGPDCRCL